MNQGLFENVEMQQESQMNLQRSPNKQGIFSEAWPDEVSDRIAIKSKMHEKIRKHIEEKKLDLKSLYFRQLDKEDIEETKNLHEEWFPLVYSQGFYDRIFKKNVIALGCFIQIDGRKGKKKQREEIMLGTIMVKINEGTEDINEIYHAKDYAQSGLTGWLSSIVMCRQQQAAYIMTIGVVDECRRYGLGTMLLSEVTKILNQSYTACEALYLHVVDYNESAIRFYEKNNFSTLKRIKNHYVIFEKNYDALVLYKDIKLSTMYDQEKQIQRQSNEKSESYVSYYLGRPYKYLKSYFQSTTL